MDIDSVTKHLLGGCPTKYDEEKHITLLARIMNNGEDIEAFCTEALIDRSTFYRWLKTHALFQQAYDILINFAERKWKSYPLTKPENFSFPYWHTIMRNRFAYGKSKIRKPRNDTPLGKLEAAFDSLQEGTLTIQEYTQLVSALQTDSQVRKSSRDPKTSTLSDINKETLIDIIKSA